MTKFKKCDDCHLSRVRFYVIQELYWKYSSSTFVVPKIFCRHEQLVSFGLLRLAVPLANEHQEHPRKNQF